MVGRREARGRMITASGVRRPGCFATCDNSPKPDARRHTIAPMRQLVALTLLAALTGNAQQDPRITRILREVPLIDGHNDLPWQYRERAKNQLAQIDLRQDQSKLEKPLHTDIARLRAGGLGAQFWSVYVPVSLKG